MICEKTVVGAGSEYPLNGMLSFPDDLKGPVPGVVFVHGSGASNMDEKVFALTPFKDLAEGLAARGIASIRYDKRTFAHAKKLRGVSPTAREETIEDAILASELLRADPRVDPERVFLVGHSMGAMLAPRIDAECGLFRGLVLLAGTPYRMEDIVRRQLGQAAAGKGGLMKWVVGLEDKIFSKKFDGLYEMSDEEAKKKKFAGSVTLWYFKEMGRKTAADYLLESEKPVLILQGADDFQVLADVDYKRFQELLGGRPRTEFKLYPGLDHAFVKSLGGSILNAAKEYKTERHIGPEVLDDIADFVSRV